MNTDDKPTITGGDVAVFYEPGWEWWHFALAFAALAAICLLLAYAVPLLRGAYDAMEDSGWFWPVMVIVAVAALFAAYWGFAFPGIMMRHTETVIATVWLGIGCLGLGLAAWVIPIRKRETDYAARFYSAPAIVMGVAVPWAGIAELLTRFASTIPTTVGNVLLVVVGGVILMLIYARK